MERPNPSPVFRLPSAPLLVMPARPVFGWPALGHDKKNGRWSAAVWFAAIAASGGLVSWLLALAVRSLLGVEPTLIAMATLQVLFVAVFTPALAVAFAWLRQRQVLHDIAGIGQSLAQAIDSGDWKWRTQAALPAPAEHFAAVLNQFLQQAEGHALALAQAQAELEARVDERTGDLELALNRVEVTAKFLSDRENLLRSILDTAADGVIICDRAARVQNFNRAAAELFGREILTARECGLASLLELRSSSEKTVVDLEIDFADLTRLVTPSRWRMLGKHSNGDIFPVDAAVSEVLVNDQILFTWIFRDITELVEAERQRRDAAEARARAERAAGMAETAAGVLHNVGNVLTSVTTSAMVLRERLESPVGKTLRKVVAFIDEHCDAAGNFVAQDERGRAVPGILRRLSEHFDVERDTWREELERLLHNVEHVGQVIASHQATARGVRGGVFQRIGLNKLIADALAVRRGELGHEWLQVVWEVRSDLEAELDEHKIMQILVNLIKNALESVLAQRPPQPQVVIRLSQAANRDIVVGVEDNGLGIAPDHLARIFSHGFTTKNGGHGFGLHNSANAAAEMGGSLRAMSKGLGEGATFLLQVPSVRHDEQAIMRNEHGATSRGQEGDGRRELARAKPLVTPAA